MGTSTIKIHLSMATTPHAHQFAEVRKPGDRRNRDSSIMSWQGCEKKYTPRSRPMHAPALHPKRYASLGVLPLALPPITPSFQEQIVYLLCGVPIRGLFMRKEPNSQVGP
jgi:hypothetical protein